MSLFLNLKKNMGDFLYIDGAGKSFSIMTQNPEAIKD